MMCIILVTVDPVLFTADTQSVSCALIVDVHGTSAPIQNEPPLSPSAPSLPHTVRTRVSVDGEGEVWMVVGVSWTLL